MFTGYGTNLLGKNTKKLKVEQGKLTQWVPYKKKFP